MRALLWKDYRANRPVLFVGLVLLLAPYAILVGWIWYNVGLTGASAAEWGEALSMAAYASLGVSQLTILLLAGTIIAGERRDRSAEFLAYLPPSRPTILASKSLLSAATAVTIWGLTLVMIGFVVPRLNAEAVSGGNRERLLDYLAVLGSSGVALFGTAWLGSSMLESPTYSTAIGLLTVILVPFLLNICHSLTAWPADGESFVYWLRLLYVGIGAASFVAGWTYYVRRVEP
jgi:ABC-type transport system involved in multi-copper enzyme maturation permease subunit